MKETISVEKAREIIAFRTAYFQKQADLVGAMDPENLTAHQRAYLEGRQYDDAEEN